MECDILFLHSVRDSSCLMASFHWIEHELVYTTTNLKVKIILKFISLEGYSSMIRELAYGIREGKISLFSTKKISAEICSIILKKYVNCNILP
jgi:hypothetical protein